jgi:hypothetical protein
MSDQVHSPASLTLKKAPPLPFEMEVVQALELVAMCWRTQLSPVRDRNRRMIPWASQPEPSHCAN